MAVRREKAIAATVIHYINDTIGDMDSGDEYDFYTHAKHWSEMKGFALGLQFNTNSPLHQSDYVETYCYGNGGMHVITFGDTEEDCLDDNVLGPDAANYGIFRPSEPGFVRFHYFVGDSPIGAMGYDSSLGHARDLLQTAYGFEQEDVDNW